MALVALLLSLVGDDARFDERTGEFVAVAAEHGFPYWIAAGTIFRGWARVKNGDVTEGISLLDSGITAFRATGGEAWIPYMLALLASGYELAEQTEEALSLLDDALQIVEKIGGYWLEAELYRRKGQLLLRQGHAGAAEALYCKALGIAEQHGAKLWELRAAVSLARLRREQGRRSAARDLLAPIYGWFTEGFDTPDLKQARALLEMLDG